MFKNIKYAIKLYVQYAWKKKASIALMLWATLALATYAEPLFISKAVQFIEVYYNTWEINLNYVYLLFALWLFITVTISLLQFVSRFYLTWKISLNEEMWETEESIWKIFNMNYWSYLSEKPWKIYKTLDRWTSAINQSAFILLQDYFRASVWILGVTMIMLYVDWRMTIATMIMIPFMWIIWYIVAWKTIKPQKTVNEEWENVFWKINNYVTNLQIVRIFNLKDKLSKNIKQNIDNIKEKQLKVWMAWEVSSIYTWTVTMLTRVIVLSSGFYFMYNNSLTFSELILFTSLIWYLYFPIWFIFNWMQTFQRVLTEIWDYREKFENMDIEKDSEWATDIKEIKWEITLKNVWFSYNKDRVIFDNLNLTVKPWEKLALVGHTGSWKSTVTNLILRLWDVNSWEILLDWKNINDITYKSLREHIWIVSQDNSLFNWTILENLQIIKDWSTIKDIEDALKKAKADFVFKLKDWINSEIWERGLKLSWWEKQRIAIARVFLKNPEIFILDEATSALDNKTEIQIQEALNELMKGKTSIIIAHRLSTIKNVDRIIMLEDWKIIEEWNYDELISKWGKFAQMANPDKLILS